MEYKVYNCDGYNIHTIKTDKFKNCSMEIMFRNNVDNDKIIEENVLVDLLMHSSKKYPKRRDVAIELENLYSSFLRGVITRMGSSVLISFITDFLNPKYCEKGFLEDVIHLPFEMILNPNIVDGEFDKRSFNIIKNRIKSDILSLKENATRYSFRRALEIMDKGNEKSFYKIGKVEDVDSITSESLIRTYNDILENYTCDIYIVGNIDMDEVVEIVKKNFKREKNKNNKINLYVDNKEQEDKLDIFETGNYEQDSLIQVYVLDKLNKRELDYTMHLVNYIFGNGGLTCKLYKYLREENSMCYLTTSMYQKHDNLEVVYAGINKKDKNKCIKLINKALTEIINGDFSDEEVDNAKKAIISSIKVSQDSTNGIINNYFFKEIDDLDYFDDRIKIFNTITKEEIMECAKKIKLNITYMLGGEE